MFTFRSSHQKHTIRPSIRVFLAVLVTVRASLPNDTLPVTFESRWRERDAMDKNYTHAVYIVRSTDEGTCSGSLIHVEWVLTAARCMCKNASNKTIVDVDSLTVYAGVDNKITDKYVQKRKSKNIKLNGDYFGVALIRLESPFDLQQPLKPLKLLSLFSVHGFKGGYEPCVSGSYGCIDWNDPPKPILKKTLAHGQRCNCSQALRAAFPDAHTEHWICNEDRYTMGLCKGDFGAAISCGRDVVAVAVDIVTYGDVGSCEILAKDSKECDKTASVSVYTDMCYHLPWVQNLTNIFPPDKPIPTCDAPDAAPPTNCLLAELYYLLNIFLLVFLG